MSRDTITRCDMCRDEIANTKPRFVVVLGIAKAEGDAHPPFDWDKIVSQKEVCSHGCALAFFKKVLGNGHSEEASGS